VSTEATQEEQRFKHFGRPSDYSDAIADEICEKLSKGASLLTICDDEGMPHPRTVYRWLANDKNEDFRHKYAHAREAQADRYAYEIIQIADDGRNDTQLDEDGNLRVDHDHIARSRLRVDARKWYASKLAPKKYGDKLQTELSGPDGGPIPISAAKLSDDELAAFVVTGDKS
jgi:hypothetical protein